MTFGGGVCGLSDRGTRAQQQHQWTCRLRDLIVFLAVTNSLQGFAAFSEQRSELNETASAFHHCSGQAAKTESERRRGPG